jgi:hypothetical protein
MQNQVQEDGMVEIIIAVAGTLLLIVAGNRRRLALQPVRTRTNRKR